MSGFFPFQLFRTTIGVAGFFGPQKKKSSGGGGTVLNFQMSPGFPSTGPLGGVGNPYPSSTGNGYQDGANNGGFAGGTTIPNPVSFNGANINTASWASNSAFASEMMLIMTGTHPQNFFSTWVFADNHSNNYNLASAAATFSTTLAPGFSVWEWAVAQTFPFSGPNVAMTINP